MAKSKIEWTDSVWNPVTGCTPVGEGCRNCYAKRMWPRLQRMSPKYAGREFTDVQCHEDVLNDPIKWKKPRTIFVNSMGDLFHDKVGIGFVSEVFRVMRSTPQHKYIVLTKRASRMRFAFRMLDAPENAIFGVSCSTQEEVGRDMLILLSTPVKMRCMSLEPLVGPIDMSRYAQCLHWVIVGGETGPNARPMHPDWVRSIRDQCTATGTPFFFKQWGEWKHDDGSDDDIDNVKRSCVYYDGEWCDCKNSWICEYQFGPVMYRVGAHRAGRLLDGREWSQTPWGGE